MRWMLLRKLHFGEGAGIAGWCGLKSKTLLRGPGRPGPTNQDSLDTTVHQPRGQQTHSGPHPHPVNGEIKQQTFFWCLVEPRKAQSLAKQGWSLLTGTLV